MGLCGHVDLGEPTRSLLQHPRPCVRAGGQRTSRGSTVSATFKAPSRATIQVLLLLGGISIVAVPVVTTGSLAANARSSSSSSASTTPSPHYPVPSTIGPKTTIWPESIKGCQYAACRPMISRSSSVISRANVGRRACSRNTKVLMNRSRQREAALPARQTERARAASRRAIPRRRASAPSRARGGRDGGG